MYEPSVDPALETKVPASQFNESSLGLPYPYVLRMLTQYLPAAIVSGRVILAVVLKQFKAGRSVTNPVSWALNLKVQPETAVSCVPLAMTTTPQLL